MLWDGLLQIDLQVVDEGVKILSEKDIYDSKLFSVDSPTKINP